MAKEEYQLQDILTLIEENEKIAFILALIGIGLLSIFLRTRNLDNLNGKLLALDPYLYLRYSRTIVKEGVLPKIDPMRSWPSGWPTTNPYPWVAYTLAYSYQLINFLIPGLSLVTWHALYPAVASFFIMVIAGLLSYEIFEDKKIAIMTSAFLTVVPAFIHRTVAGFADKEALATVSMLASLLALTKAYKNKDEIKKLVIYSLLAGLASGYMGQIWGGSAFLTITIGGFFLSLFLFGRSDRKDIFILGLYSLVNYFLMIFPTEALGGFAVLRGFQQTMPLIALGVLGLNELIGFIREKVEIKELKGVPDVGITLGILGIGLLISGLTIPWVSSQISAALTKLRSPLKGNVMSTVAESQQPVFYPDWWSQFSWLFIPFLLGTTIMFYKTFKSFKNSKLLSIVFLIFLTFFIISNTGRRGTLGAMARTLGDQHINALFIFFGIFLLCWGYGWYENKKGLDKIKGTYLILLVWTLLSTAGARGAMRLFYMLALPASILAAYFFKKAADFISEFEPQYRYISYIIAGGIFLLFFGQAQAQVQRTGPSYSPTWQSGGEWVKNNTAKDSSFIFWWDYGYWIQTMWNRPTVRDGGHPGVCFKDEGCNLTWEPFGKERIDYYVAKGLFLAKNKTTAYKTLKFFSKPDYFLVISDEIPKFGAITSIAGHPTTFTRLGYQTQNGRLRLYPRNQLMRKYPSLSQYEGYSQVAVMRPKGYIRPNKTIQVNGKTYSPSNSMVGAVFQLRNNQTVGPHLAIIYNREEGHSSLVGFKKTCKRNMGCIKLNKEGLSGGIMTMKGGALYIPPYAMGKLFTDLYVIGEGYEGFELAYDDSTSFERGALSGRTDMKIWKINYTELSE